MSFQLAIDPGLDKTGHYQLLAAQAEALLAGEPDRIANAANLAALLFNSLPDINWAGFYFYVGGELVVGPFQGLPACVRIPLGKGVCGSAAETRQVLIVDDVDQFPGHIACDSASRSEIVIPIVRADQLIGVLDVDSPKLARFDAQDRDGLSRLVEVFAATL